MNSITNEQIVALFIDEPKKTGLVKLESPQSNKYDLYYYRDNPAVKVAIARGKVEDGVGRDYGYALTIQLAAIIADGDEPLFLHPVLMKPNDSSKTNDWKLYKAKLFYDSSEKGPRAPKLIEDEIYWYKNRVKREEMNFFVPEVKNLKLLINGGIDRMGVRGTGGSTYSERIEDIPNGWNELYNDAVSGTVTSKYSTEELKRMVEEEKKKAAEREERLRKEKAEREEKKRMEQEAFAAEYPLLAKLGITKKIMNIVIAIFIILLLIYIFA